jgi:DNA-binding MarR family transcriptional regulator
MDTHIKLLARQLEHIANQIGEHVAFEQVRVFIAIALHQGITLPDLEKIVDMGQTATARNVKRLSRYMSRGEILGYDVVRTERDLRYPKRLACSLTARGKAIIEGVPSE